LKPLDKLANQPEKKKKTIAREVKGLEERSLDLLLNMRSDV